MEFDERRYMSMEELATKQNLTGGEDVGLNRRLKIFQEELKLHLRPSGDSNNAIDQLISEGKITWQSIKLQAELAGNDYIYESNQPWTNHILEDFDFNPKLRYTGTANCLLAALNILFQGPFLTTQQDFNKAVNRRQKKSQLQATYKYAKKGGNEVPVGRPLIKALINNVPEWMGLKLSAKADRSDIKAWAEYPTIFLTFVDKFQSTNILMAADHLNQHGPLSQAGHAYIIRNNRATLQWEIINPGATFSLDNQMHLKELKALFSDIMSARFYEIQGTGTNNLVEATLRLKKYDPTLIKKQLISAANEDENEKEEDNN